MAERREKRRDRIEAKITTAQQVHWQYGGATNKFSAFVRYSASVPADE